LSFAQEDIRRAFALYVARILLLIRLTRIYS